MYCILNGKALGGDVYCSSSYNVHRTISLSNRQIVSHRVWYPYHILAYNFHYLKRTAVFLTNRWNTVQLWSKLRRSLDLYELEIVMWCYMWKKAASLCENKNLCSVVYWPSPVYSCFFFLFHKCLRLNAYSNIYQIPCCTIWKRS